MLIEKITKNIHSAFRCVISIKFEPGAMINQSSKTYSGLYSTL
jgi:hypothetical protein